MTTLSNAERASRRPVWGVLTERFLDTNLTALDCAAVQRQLG